ncbi:glycosyltransferase [Salipiger aestuarii]|uniref:Glycosyltransferase involved in cell wall biosynthesis n=1 Tax=Salipiger aestuarii TaxID=568098 RepID=A0A327XH63_9RHOB|nr:glycosyltransferase [Salipiger aestuarii]KAA8606127.1 glycosyltransferase [Salipiger aestuarii]KAB2532699.1 glycosyltransferase [Salipiger aestuarii]RAK07814.1 glycosyltransferase involved in cell wall biosynthesis [Salipiger aestuarii]
MRILFYNWVDYLDDERRGGGVSIYQKNVIHALNAEEATECLFLSSGISYDLLNDRPRWEQVRHGPTEDRALRFEIVNSGALAPGHHSFGDPRQVEDPATEAAFFDFLRAKGPFDVVHFNNLEGIPAGVLKLKEHFPDTRVILSLHNYFPVCPQVNLWYQEEENCLDYENGRKCVTCLPYQHDQRVIRLANGVAFNLKKAGIRPGSRLFDRGFGPAMRVANRLVRFWARRIRRSRPASLTPATAPQRAPGQVLERLEARNAKFAKRRRDMATLINTHCDSVLCVSHRVGEVAARYGIAPDLLETSYIGTRHADKFAQTRPAVTLLGDDGLLTMGYLGYMRRDKGFFFMLEALEGMPDALAARIRLVIASRRADAETMERVVALSERFASVQYADGYAHDQLDALLDGVGVGVIPVLWEDNLPQVAIEMHARHIPLLTSDLGGAQELGGSADMRFTSGDIDDFHARVQAMLDGEIDLSQYWSGALAPYSMENHLAELHQVYASPVRPIGMLPSAPGADPELGRDLRPVESIDDNGPVGAYEIEPGEINETQDP